MRPPLRLPQPMPYTPMRTNAFYGLLLVLSLVPSPPTYAQNEEAQAVIEVRAEILEGLEGPGASDRAGIGASGVQSKPDAVLARLMQLSRDALDSSAAASTAYLLSAFQSVPQSPEALVALVIVDADGHVRAAPSRRGMSLDVIGQSIELAAPRTSSVLGRDAGLSYYYIQVCACAN